MFGIVLVLSGLGWLSATASPQVCYHLASNSKWLQVIVHFIGRLPVLHKPPVLGGFPESRQLSYTRPPVLTSIPNFTARTPEAPSIIHCPINFRKSRPIQHIAILLAPSLQY
ncbi:hypothetical protein BKA67DRAFT_86362 [Truncatella angustata]|uniref:Secreted protein n=1 Tax=Truncatella angustata TaxID=152316 RepID=A0A9P8RGW4_9PEZI|nr:uncharacterized protein BKA67DRAFT_86362 [Truncatella angustata]KAH6645804.1 hypothetical protein BKA67DRAFT_86362 [Truncatella angustata]